MVQTLNKYLIFHWKGGYGTKADTQRLYNWAKYVKKKLIIWITTPKVN